MLEPKWCVTPSGLPNFSGQERISIRIRSSWFMLERRPCGKAAATDHKGNQTPTGISLNHTWDDLFLRGSYLRVRISRKRRTDPRDPAGRVGSLVSSPAARTLTSRVTCVLWSPAFAPVLSYQRTSAANPKQQGIQQQWLSGGRRTSAANPTATGSPGSTSLADGGERPRETDVTFPGVM